MKKLAQGAIATTPGTLAYTVPNKYKTEVKDISISNTTAGALTILLHLVPSGVAVGTSNQLFPAISIPAYTLMHWEGLQILNEGDFIQAIGSGAGLTMNISGDEAPMTRLDNI